MEFYDWLSSDEEFCKELGKAILAASKLEVVLWRYLEDKDISVREKEATLGTLTRKLKTNDLVGRNFEMVLTTLTTQRNYLTHSLYALFSGKIKETLLPVNELSAMDVELFSEKAQILAQDLNYIANVAVNELNRHNKSLNTDTHCVGAG